MAESYRQGEAYEYGQAFLRAAREVAGEDLARALLLNTTQYQGFGRDRLTEENVARMRSRYERFDHPAAREVLAWLNGAYDFSLAEIEAT